MAKKKTILKRQRQETKKRAYNKKIKDAMKKTVKTVKKSVISQNPETKEQLKKAQKMIDKAAEKGVIHKNTAARKKSGLTRFVNKYSK
ncbi:MAG: 30S ribosomal protein S20 [Elusimicrobia bacterium]|nr:30S ribosomal protein S20 [Elusimicrobiota bacterium]